VLFHLGRIVLLRSYPRHTKRVTKSGYVIGVPQTKTHRVSNNNKYVRYSYRVVFITLIT